MTGGEDVISFALLRDKAWAILRDEIGENAPYPQLYSVWQQDADLSAIALLPLTTEGRTVISSGWDWNWLRPRSNMKVNVIVVTILIFAMVAVIGALWGTYLKNSEIVLLSPIPPAQEQSPLGQGVDAMASAAALRAGALNKELFEHAADCETVNLHHYPDIVALTYSGPAQSEASCGIGPNQWLRITFKPGVRAYGMSYSQGLDYLEIVTQLKDGRQFVQTSKEFFPNLVTAHPG